jgi:hypothetical protein
MEEVLMIARNVTMHLKPNSAAEFTQTFQKEILPLLRQQKGFQDEITFIIPGGQDAVGVSFWDKQENADAYSQRTYPEVLKTLRNVLDGIPQVQHFEVLNSTFHNIRVFAH